MKKSDQVYQEMREKYAEALVAEIQEEAAGQWAGWQRKGRLPLWLRVKNKVTGKGGAAGRGNR